MTVQAISFLLYFRNIHSAGISDLKKAWTKSMLFIHLTQAASAAASAASASFSSFTSFASYAIRNGR